jgi:hypothetical protein
MLDCVLGVGFGREKSRDGWDHGRAQARREGLLGGGVIHK